MRIEPAVKVLKLSVNFRVVKKGFDYTNYTKRGEYSNFERYKKINNIVATNEYPLLLMEFSGSDANLSDLNLKLKIEVNSNVTLDFDFSENKPPRNLVLLSLSGINKLSIKIESVKFKIENKEYKEVSSNAPIEYDRAYFDAFDDKSKIENYHFLTSYLHETFIFRGILLKVAFKNLEEISTNHSFSYKGKKYVYSNVDDLNRIKSLIQIEIISMIMMYIEDLIILLESNRLNKNFYELLDIRSEKELDVGKRIGKFFDSMDSFTLRDWRRILCYVGSKDPHCSSAINTVFSKNIEAVKTLLKDVESFGQTHHRIFRRFKHAGFPIRYAGKMNLNKIFTLQSEFYTSVFVGKNILNDLALLPYSEGIIESYLILITTLQFFIRDVLIFRINCILRNVSGIIPSENFLDPFEAMKHENEYIKARDKFNLAHPKKFFDTNVISKLNDSYLKEMTWYRNYEANRKKWKEKGELTKKFSQEYKVK